MATCPAFDAAAPYLVEMLRATDCQALALGADGYAAVGSEFALAAGALITLVVALVGYRLLLAGDFGPHRAFALMLRLGFVVALATQWGAYRPLVYDVITQGPGEFARLALAPGGLGGDAPATLIARAQSVHDALVAFAKPAPGEGGGPGALSAPARHTLERGDQLFTVSVLAGVLAPRVIAGLLLALGPLFLAALLFAGSEGLFFGWLRVMLGAAIASTAAPLVTALALAVIEPQLAALAQHLAAGIAVDALPQDLLVSTLVFATIMLAALLAAARTAAALRRPPPWRRAGREFDAAASRRAAGATALPPAPRAAPPVATRNRAEAVADAVRRNDARRLAFAHANAGPAPGFETGPMATLPQPIPLGQASRRSTPRRSAAAAIRDARA